MPKAYLRQYLLQYEFLRLQFGLKNAAATFQRLMTTVLASVIGKFCFVYIIIPRTSGNSLSVSTAGVFASQSCATEAKLIKSATSVNPHSPLCYICRMHTDRSKQNKGYTNITTKGYSASWDSPAGTTGSSPSRNITIYTAISNNQVITATNKK